MIAGEASPAELNPLLKPDSKPVQASGTTRLPNLLSHDRKWKIKADPFIPMYRSVVLCQMSILTNQSVSGECDFD